MGDRGTLSAARTWHEWMFSRETATLPTFPAQSAETTVRLVSQSVEEPLTWVRNSHQNLNCDSGTTLPPPVPPSVVYKGSIERIQLPDDRRLWSLPHKTNRSTSRFSYKKKIHQNPEAVRISAVCEAASNTDCRGGDLCTAGTGIIKRPLAEWVLKPRFSRPDSQAFPPGSQPLPAGWGEQVASGAIPGKSPPGPALPFVM